MNIEKMCENRRELVKNLPKSWTRGVEMGVRDGFFSRFILENTNLDLDSIDPWEANQELSQPLESFELCQKNLSSFGKRSKMIKGCGEVEYNNYPDNSLDFVYIDALHDFDSVYRDVSLWYPKVKIGGIISGHDFSPSWPGVMQAVNTFFKQKAETIYISRPLAAEREQEMEYDGFQPSWWTIKCPI